MRALTPHIGAYVVLEDGTRLGVSAARVVGDGSPPTAPTPPTPPTPPAGAVSLAGPRPVLGCAQGALELLVVQPPGRRPMPAEDYLRGRRS